MPALDQKVIDDVTTRLSAYLSKMPGYSSPEYLTSGGSAAIFKVESPHGTRAFKVFDPKFFGGDSGDAERRRLEVQRRLIGQECASLVHTYRVDEAENTAIMEMEFVPWQDLNKTVREVPDAEVGSLIRQLVTVARFLEDQGIVHRDIKPENIKISPDFKSLKLLDLGVARDIEAPDDADAAITDHGNARPFLATAQYSSPEYLFRLDEPSPRLWKGLNFYQVGAVLHDLIMKNQLFNLEMEAGNRWLVSKAVLTKIPSFVDGDVNRLRELKALAARCLVKDLDFRLQTVGWDDFSSEGATDHLSALRGRLAKGGMSVGMQTKAAVDDRLEFERGTLAKRLMDRVRNDLISVCGASLPSSMSTSTDRLSYIYSFSPNKSTNIRCQIDITWLSEIYANHANLSISALIFSGDENQQLAMPPKFPICVISIGGNEDIAVKEITDAIAKAVNAGLDIVAVAENVEEIKIEDLVNNK